MTRWIAVMLAAVGLAGSESGVRAGRGAGTGHGRRHHHSRRRTFFTEGKNTNGPSFGNYGLGARRRGQLQSVRRRRGRSQRRARRHAGPAVRPAATSNLKTPNLLNYSGNLVVSAANRSSVVPYVTGGVGGLTLFEKASLGINGTETFLTGNVGGGVKWFTRPLGPARRLPVHRRPVEGRRAELLRTGDALRPPRLRRRADQRHGAEDDMLKRMIVMLAVTTLIVAGLGFVKFKQIQAAIAQGAAFQPPPEAVTTIVASQEEWPSTLTAIGTVAAVRGVTVSADLPGVVDEHRLRIGPGGSRGRRAGRARHAAGAGAAGGRRGAARSGARQLQPHAGAAERAGDLAGRVRPRDRRTAAGRGAGRRDPRDDRAKDDPRAVLRRPRHPSGQPRSVPLRRRRAGDAAVAESDLRELRRAAAGDGAGARRPHRARHGDGLDGVDVHRPDHGDRFGRRRVDAERPGAGDARQSGRRSCVPACSCRPKSPSARQAPSSRCRPRRSATRRTATRSSSSPT